VLKKTAPIQQRLRRIKKTFKSAFFLYENNDVQSSVTIATLAIAQLSKVFEELKSTDSAALSRYLDDKRPVLSGLKKTFDELREKAERDEDTIDEVDYENALDRLGSLVDNATSEVPRILRSPAELKKLRVKWMSAAAAGAMVVGFFLIHAIYRHFTLKGHGLIGEYYSDMEFKNLATTRLDPTIDFDWGLDAPMKTLPEDRFSIRWTGSIEIKNPGNYEFYTLSDDGVKVYLEDIKLIDNWSAHPATLDKGNAFLNPGRYRLKIEYFDQAADAVIKLYWKREKSLYREIIPADVLFPPAPPKH